MKALIRLFGGILLVCGVILFIGGGIIQKELKPQTVTLGYYTDGGQFIQTDQGLIGGNQKGYEDASMVKGIGIAAGVTGIVLLAVGRSIKEDKPYVH